MAKHVRNDAEDCDNDDRRMNAYMAGIQSTSDDSGDEDDEVEVSRRQKRRARRMTY